MQGTSIQPVERLRKHSEPLQFLLKGVEKERSNKNTVLKHPTTVKLGIAPYTY